MKKSQSLFLSDGAPPPLQSLSTAADEKTEERGRKEAAEMNGEEGWKKGTNGLEVVQMV